MTAGERLIHWIEGLTPRWADRLAAWGIGLFARSATKTLEDTEPAVKESAEAFLTWIRTDPMVPEEIKNHIEKALGAGNIWETIYLELIMILQSLGVILGGSVPIANELRYAQDYLKRSSRLDPSSVMTAWRRDPEAYSKYFDDLKEQGWSDDRIEALKFVTLVYPSRQDGLRYVAKEALEPDAIAKYGLMDEFDRIDLSLFAQIGVPEETVRLDWIAHWEHASWIQIVEMLHRGLITEQEVYEWFRVVEIVPYWRDLLIQTAYTWPTRVDVRRWWDMRTIDEPELRRLYSGMGYRGVNLDNYVLWTKVYTAFPDLMARWSKGWITLDQVKSELTALGMPAARIEEFIQMKVKAAEPERITGERDITKTDIIKGVKMAVITRGEGVELLVDMGYDEDEAVYILEINIPPDEEDVVVSQRELTKADILRGLKTAVITRADAGARLQELRYSPADAEFLLKIYDAQVEPPTEPREREASKADIILAVKKGLITAEDAYLMLLDIDFTPEAAAFILEVKAEVSPFSPVNFAEFKDLTQKYRFAAGMEAKPMPEEIKMAAAEVVKLTGEVAALDGAIIEEERLMIDQEIIPEETTKRLKTLRVKRNRAISTLTTAKSDYDRLVAEWRHGLS